MEEPAAAAQNDTNFSQYDTSFISTSNWTVADGSLADSITFESSLSFDDDVDNSTPPKSPLILCPPTPDPGPCDITITFAQKHEVRQVYVRSSARVYEIYCAPVLCGSNEYLCTVRCSVATRDEEVLCTPNAEEAASANLKGGSKELDEKKSGSNSSSSTNEDGWVEVKAVDSPQHYGGNSPAPSNFNARLVGSSQDLYEATAEISDAEPCMSITLRLLSLQNKGCVFVDEIFVFADPVEPDDSDNRVGQMENSAGTSLMAMFMPTLLQLSKTRNAGQIRDDHSCDTGEKQKSQGISPEAIDSTNVSNNIQQEGDSGLVDKQKVQMQETVGSAAIPAQVEMPPQVSDTESKSDMSCSRIEKALDQLVSRVSRVEDLFLRFEESMVKPISSIEARLQQIEQKLEELTKKPQNSGLLRCTRFSAPEFSCPESDDNFIYNNKNATAESDEVKECLSSIPPDDSADLVDTNQYRSCLIVTAPEFSNGDDDKENDALEAATVSSKDKTKKALSVDDALAYALAGFLSSASPEPQTYTQALAIKAPDFSGEEDSNSGKTASTEVEGGRANSPICFSGTVETECINDSMSNSSDNFCLESQVYTMTSDDHHFEKTGEVVDNLCHHNEEGEGDSQDGSIQYTVAPAVQEVAETDLYQQITEDKTTVENQNDDGSDASQEVAVANSESSAATEETSDKDVLEFPHTSSVVNFEMPILDVKFVSLESSNSNYLLETLLDEIPENEIAESNVESPFPKENDDGSQIGQQRNLISVDDPESASAAASGNCFFMDTDYCSLLETPSNMEGNKLQDCCSTNDKIKQFMDNSSLLYNGSWGSYLVEALTGMGHMVAVEVVKALTRNHNRNPERTESSQGTPWSGIGACNVDSRHEMVQHRMVLEADIQA
ncbi:hypothetical protein EZV62_017131 [Acer yangbiense]|uniref:Uncharacterized protein n=1 Tax=Acer yangbiense TaxID=1000413 RepID=A0A5C7HGC5_9ROSI|nr:hypothetical protein EZV62_017131 [Acer yangbiense]